MEAFAGGMAIGTGLFIAKYISFYVLTGGLNPYSFQRPINILKYLGIGFIIEWIVPPGARQLIIKDVIKRSMFLLFITDAIFGYVGMHLILPFGGSIAGMTAMAMYTFLCAVILFTPVLYNAALNKVKSSNPYRFINALTKGGSYEKVPHHSFNNSNSTIN